MRSIIEILIALAIAALFFVGLGFLLPNSGKIERHIEIERPAVHVFDMVNSTRRFLAWQPWTANDPGADVTFSDVVDGNGARASWASDMASVGKGSQEIMPGSVLEKEVRMKVEMPNRQGVSAILIEPMDVGVKVSMTFETQFNGLVERYKGLYLDSEQGDKLNLALARLKATLENSPYAADYAEAGVQEKALIPVPALSLTSTAKGYSTQPLNVPRDRQVAIETVAKAVAANNLTAQPPQFIELSRDPINYVVVFDTIVPVDKTDGVKLAGDIKAIMTPGGNYLVAKHVGNREGWYRPGQTKDKMLAYAAVHDIRIATLESGRKIYAEYLSPPETLEAQFETNIYVPVE
jgi:hypothetical protein